MPQESVSEVTKRLLWLLMTSVCGAIWRGRSGAAPLGNHNNGPDRHPCFVEARCWPPLRHGRSPHASVVGLKCHEEVVSICQHWPV